MKKGMNKKPSGFIFVFEMMMVLLVFAMTTLVSGGKSALITIGNFIDMPSLVLLFLFTVPVLFVSGMAKDFVMVFSVGKKPCSLAQMKKTLEAIQMLQKLVLCGAGFMLLIEIMMIFSKLDDLTILGPNISVALLSVLYGIITESLLIPLGAYVQNHITDALDVKEDTEITAVTVVEEEKPARSSSVRVTIDAVDKDEEA